MAKANIKGTTAVDFLRPEEARPANGPLYAVNLTKTRIVFSAKKDFPAFSFGPYPAQDSIHQIPVAMLDTVEFMRFWASGKLAVSKDPKVAKAHVTLEVERASEQKAQEAAVKDSLEDKAAAKTFDVKTSSEGLPEVVEVPKQRRSRK